MLSPFEWCVATSFYQRSAFLVPFYPFLNLRNLLYLIRILLISAYIPQAIAANPAARRVKIAIPCKLILDPYYWIRYMDFNLCDLILFTFRNKYNRYFKFSFIVIHPSHIVSNICPSMLIISSMGIAVSSVITITRSYSSIFLTVLIAVT